MSEFENAAPKKEQELKDRTDETIRGVGKLGDEDLSQVAGGDDCVNWSKYACALEQCDYQYDNDCQDEYC